MTNQYFFYRIDNALKKIDLDEIVFLEAAGNYTRFYTTSKDFHLVRSTLDAALSQLPEHRFLRIHRSFVVPGHLLLEVKRGMVYLGRNDQQLLAELPVSKQYYASLTKQFVIFDSSPAGSKNEASTGSA